MMPMTKLSGNASIKVLMMLMIVLLGACTKSTHHVSSIRNNKDSVLALIPCDDTMSVDTVYATDSTVCVFGWDNQTGGQMINWSAVYTVRDEDGSVYAFEGLPDWQDSTLSLVTAIHSLPHPERHLYLLETWFKEWSAVAYIGLVAYERFGHELKRVPLIRDEQGQLVSEWGFEYDALELSRESICAWDESVHAFLSDGYGSYQWNGETFEPLPDRDFSEKRLMWSELKGFYTAEDGTYYVFFEDGTVALAPEEDPQPYTIEMAYGAPTNVIVLPDGRRFGYHVNEDALFLHEADLVEGAWQLSDRLVMILERQNEEK